MFSPLTFYNNYIKFFRRNQILTVIFSDAWLTLRAQAKVVVTFDYSLTLAALCKIHKNFTNHYQKLKQFPQGRKSEL